jgi:5'(3')-deoxyribonucleotidase
MDEFDLVINKLEGIGTLSKAALLDVFNEVRNERVSDEVKTLVDTLHLLLCKEHNCMYILEGAMDNTWTLRVHREWVDNLKKFLEEHLIVVSDASIAVYNLVKVVREIEDNPGNVKLVLQHYLLEYLLREEQKEW